MLMRTTYILVPKDSEDRIVQEYCLKTQMNLINNRLFVLQNKRTKMRFKPQTEVKIIRSLADHLAHLKSSACITTELARNTADTAYGFHCNRTTVMAALNYINQHRKILVVKIAAGDFTPIKRLRCNRTCKKRSRFIALAKKQTTTEHVSGNANSNKNDGKEDVGTDENITPSADGEASDSNFVQVQHSAKSGIGLITQSIEGTSHDNHYDGITVVDKTDDLFAEEKFHSEYIIPDDGSQPQPTAPISNSTTSLTEPSKMNRDCIDSDMPLAIASDLPQEEALRREYKIPDDLTLRIAFKDDSIQARKAKLCMEIVQLAKQTEMEISRFQETMANLRSQQREKEKMLQNLLLQ